MKASEMLHILKVQNKRLFIIWLVTFVAFIGLLGYTLWLLNDIGVETTTTSQEINDVESIDNSNLVNGDYNGEDKADKNN